MTSMWPIPILVGAVLVTLLPVFIATARRHHQRLAISALVLVPLVLAGGGVLLLGTGNFGGIPLVYLGLYILPLPWFIALVWSLTSVRRYVPVAAPAAAPSATGVRRKDVPKPAWTDAEQEERRDQRRSRGY